MTEEQYNILLNQYKLEYERWAEEYNKLLYPEVKKDAGNFFKRFKSDDYAICNNALKCAIMVLDETE